MGSLVHNLVQTGTPIYDAKNDALSARYVSCDPSPFDPLPTHYTTTDDASYYNKDSHRTKILSTEEFYEIIKDIQQIDNGASCA